MTFDKLDLLLTFWLTLSMLGPLLQNPMARAEWFLLISPKLLIVFRTKVSLLTYQCLVCTTISLNKFLAVFLTDQLHVGLMASSLNVIVSTLAYLVTLSSRLFYSSSSSTTYIHLRLPVFTLLLMILI